MLFFRSILIIFLLTTSVSSNEIPSIKFVSLDYIIKNSIIGKKLSKMNTDQRNSLIKKNKKIESDLQKQKDELTSKYVDIIDSNGNHLGNVEIYIISPYEEE